MDTFRPENFMLLPTMACQAGCRYCFAKKTGEVMTRKTAEKALNFMACIAPERKDIHLTFHGGEPLLAGEDFYEWILPLLWHRFGRRVRLVVNPVVHAYLTAGGLNSIRRGWNRKYKCKVKAVKDGSFTINQSEWYDPVTNELLCSFFD